MTAIAYLNGAYVDAAEARLPVYDLGVVGGLAVAEMLRTFRHEPFRVDEHLSRLQQSLRLTGLAPKTSHAELAAALRHVVQVNTSDADADDDIGVIVFVTAGWNPTYVGHEAAAAHGRTVCIHTFPLQYAQWAAKYETGVRLQSSPIPALPGSTVDRRIKSRSRMHWHLADQAVRRVDPQATALLCDEQGYVTETAAANVCAILEGVIVSPPAGSVLEGVSLQVVAELASDVGFSFERRQLPVAELYQATEIFLTSTPSCLLPVCQFDQRPVGEGRPGPVFLRLLESWSSLVGVDIAEQARRFARAASARSDS